MTSDLCFDYISITGISWMGVSAISMSFSQNQQISREHDKQRHTLFGHAHVEESWMQRKTVFLRLGHLSFRIVHDVHYRLLAYCYLYSVACKCNNMSVNGRSVSVAVKHQLLMRTLWDNCAINQSFSLSHAEITSDKRGLPEGRGGYLKDSPTGSLPFKHVYSSRCGLISSASEPYWTLKIRLNYLWNFVIFAKWNIAKWKLKKNLFLALQFGGANSLIDAAGLLVASHVVHVVILFPEFGILHVKFNGVSLLKLIPTSRVWGLSRPLKKKYICQ